MRRLIILVSTLAIFVPVLALATTFMSNSNVNSGQTINGNLYLTGDNILVAGTVTGDLLAAGSTLVISGTVENDAMIAGGNVIVTGTVMGDVRAAGGTVDINGKINGEVVVAGGRVNIGPQAQITGDLMASGGEVIVDPAAKVTGKVMVNTGDKDVKEAQPPRNDFAAIFMAVAFGILSTLVAAFIFGLVSKSGMQRIINTGIERKGFWKNIGLGFALLFLTPILALLFLITGFGYLVGFILLFGYILLIFVGIVLGGVIFGGLMQSAYTKTETVNFHWGWLIAGVVLASIISLIPIVGWIFGFVIFLLAIGTLMRVNWAMAQ